jgi:hypothetical protein
LPRFWAWQGCQDERLPWKPFIIDHFFFTRLRVFLDVFSLKLRFRFAEQWQGWASGTCRTSSSGADPLPAKHSKGADDDTELHHLDMFRDQPLLGWEGNHPSFIKASFDVNSHHFDLFDMRKASRLFSRYR